MNGIKRRKYVAFFSPVRDPRHGNRVRDFRVNTGTSPPAMARRCSALNYAADCPGRTRSPCCRCLKGGVALSVTGRPRYRSGALKSSVFGVPEPDADSSVAARVAVFVADSESHLLRNSEQLYDSSVSRRAKYTCTCTCAIKNAAKAK